MEPNYCAWCGDLPTASGLTPALVGDDIAIVCQPCAEGLAAEERLGTTD